MLQEDRGAGGGAMQGIVCIAGTNRPDNDASRALAIVVDEFQHHQEVCEACMV